MPKYQVDQILDERLLNNVKEYKIQWRGYSEDFATWEPKENILTGFDDLYDDFLANRARLLNSNKKSTAGRTPSARSRSVVKDKKEVASPAPRSRSKKAAPRADKAEKVAVNSPAVATERKRKSTKKEESDIEENKGSESDVSTPVVAESLHVVKAKSNDHDYNLLFPVIVTTTWLSLLVHFAWVASIDASLQTRAIASFIFHFIGTAMLTQSFNNAILASHWCSLIQSSLALSSIALFLNFSHLTSFTFDELKNYYIAISFGVALQDGLIFSTKWSFFKTLRVAIETVLYSSILWGPELKVEMINFIFSFFVVFRVADAFLSIAHVCTHKASSTFFHVVSYLIVLAGLAHYLATNPDMDQAQLSLFGLYFFSFLCYVTPGPK